MNTNESKIVGTEGTARSNANIMTPTSKSNTYRRDKIRMNKLHSLYGNHSECMTKKQHVDKSQTVQIK